MSATLKIAGIESLVAGLSGKLNGKDLRLDLLEGKVSATSKLGIEDVTFTVRANAAVSVRSFDSPDDEDPGHVVGGGKSRGNALPPVLEPGPAIAFLKYLVEAQVGATGKAALSFAEITAGASRSVLMADYRGHDPEEPVAGAILADVSGGLRVPVRWKDILDLGPNDALSYQVRGRLQTQVEVTWGDVVTSALPALTGLLHAATTIRLKTSLGATLATSLEVTDELLLVFTQPSRGRVRLGVRKARGRSTEVGASLGIDVGFEKPEEVARLIEGLVADVAGEAIGTIDRILAKASLDDLSPAERRLVEEVLRRIGGATLLDGIARVRERWQDVKDTMTRTVAAAAKARVKAGFRYDYGRIATDESLLEAEIAADSLRGFHGDLLCSRLTPLTRFLRDAKPAEARVLRYLHESRVGRKASWGFSLSLLGLAVSGKDESALEEKRQIRIDGTYVVAYKGARTYTSRLFEHRGWIADFKADTSHFSPGPTAADLYYGLHLQLTWSGKPATEVALRAIVDEAIVWRVVDEDDEDALVAELLSLSKGKRLESRLELTVEDLPTRAFARRVAEAPEADLAFARALARALPRWDVSLARSVVPVREEVYAPLWALYLREAGLSPRDLAAAAGRHLRSIPAAKNAAPWEERVYHEAVTGSLSWLVEKNDRTAADWRSFRKGCEKLQTAIASRWDHTAFKEIYELVERPWRQLHSVRAIGALLTGPEIGVPRDQRTASLSIDVNGKRALVLGRA